MSQLVCRRVVAGLMAGGLLLASAAQAADPPPLPPKQPPPDSMLSGLTVTAPRTIEQNRDGVTSQIVHMSVSVPYGDLDMRTAAGVAELNKRVKKAADYVCNQLEIMYPTGTPDDFYCAKQAVTDARPQVIKASAPG